MEREDPLEPLNETGSWHDQELAALFKRIEPPTPSSSFVAKTMRAVKREPLPDGRRPLRNPFPSVIGWAAAAALAGVGLCIAVMSQPLLASAFGALVTNGVGIGVRLVQFAGTGFAVMDFFASTGLAFSKAAVTREGTAGLLLTAVVGALALSALHRLLMSDGEGSSWRQELS
jgi:hypothetical protein